jgi:hypothetical protein
MALRVNEDRASDAQVRSLLIHLRRRNFAEPSRRGYCFCRAVPQQRGRASWIIVAAVALGSTSCTRQDERLQQHREKFESLGSSTMAIGEAWLAGSTSGTFTGTALEQTFLLVEQQRSALAARPEALLDPRGAELSQAAERLSRLIATTIGDVRAADTQSVRQHLTTIPIAPSVSR